MDIKDYLKRIGYDGSLGPTLEVLRALQQCHLLSVPFENLDIHYGNTIRLDITRIYNKIVYKHRGGFCYEVNGLFYEVLKNLGFDVRRISARVYDDKSNDFGYEFDHLAIMVRIEDDLYLVDVGYGEFSMTPIKFELGVLHTDSRGSYMIEAFDDSSYCVYQVQDLKKEPEYRFSLLAREFDEFEEMCKYHQTSIESSFTKNRMISMFTKTGRITISNNQLKIKEGVRVIQEECLNEDVYQEVLKKYFGIIEL